MIQTQSKQTAFQARGLALGHLLNIPNFLTLLRLFSIPIFFGLLSERHYRYALYLFVAAALTDALAGTVARWFDSRTDSGAFLPPFYDKLLLHRTFVTLTFSSVF